MAEVGVLNLTIKDNSDKAAGGLNNLVGALTRVKNIVGTSLGLSTVNKELKEFAATVSRQTKTTTVIKSLTAFGVAMEKLSKITNAINFDTKPIGDLKKAIGDGINLKGNPAGQLTKIRDALGGDWGDGSAITAMKGIKTLADSYEKGGTAKKLKDVADGMKAYVTQLKEVEKANGTKNGIEGALGGGTGLGMRLRGVDKNGNRIDEPFGLQHFGGKGNQIKDNVKGIMEQQTELQKMQDVINGTLRDMPVGGIDTSKGAGDVKAVSIASQIEAAVERAKNSTDGLAQATGQTEGLFQTVASQAETIAESVQNENSALQQVNKTLEEQIRIRQEMFAAANQKRLENNYESFRELYMSGEDDWQSQVPEMYGFTPKSIEQGETYADALRITMQEVNAYVDEFIRKTSEPAGELLRDTIDQAMEANLAFKSAQESAAVLKNAPELQSVADGMTQVASSTQGMDGALANTSQKTTVLTDDLKDLDKELKSKKTDTEEATSAFKRFKQGISSIMKPITNLGKRLQSMIISRSLRYLVRTVAKGFSEGINNVYEYSKAVGNSFAPAMDSAKASVEKFKNSVGAAAAPIIQALIPILNSLANAAVTALNYVNQLFSLLTGQSYWVKATGEVDDYTKAVKGAGGATNDWLAGFDELEVMSAPGGGGGGGGSQAQDYSDMFKNVTEFDQKIRDIVEFIKSNMESIKGIAIAIGTAILAWKLSTAFAELLPTLSTILGYVATGATIAITLQATWMLTNKYLDTGSEGWLLASALTTAIGSTAAWAVAKKLIGGQAGIYAAAITLALSAVTDIAAVLGKTEIDALSKESILTNIKAALSMGAAAGVFLKAKGATTALTLQGAGGAALVTFGVAMGLKAITDASHTAWDTKNAIIKSLVAAAPVGIGLAVLGVPVVAAAGAAFATFAVVLGLQAFISKNNTTWGTVNLTDEEVQAFVNTKMFNVDVKTTVGIISDKIEFSLSERLKLTAQLAKVVGKYDIIKLGVADTADYSNLDQLINGEDGLIAKVNSYIQTAREAGELTIQYTPTLAGEGVDEQGTWFTNYNAGWDKVEKFVKDKGAEIGEWLTNEEKRKILESKPEILAGLMQQLNDVTSAIASAEIKYNALGKLKIGIGDFDQATVQNIEKYFREYKQTLETEYAKLVNDQITKQGELVAALFEVDPEGEEYRQAKAELERMVKDADKAIRDQVAEATADGKALVLDWLFGKHGKGGASSVNSTYVPQMRNLLSNAGVNAETMSTIIHELLQWNGVTQEEINIMDLVGFSGWDLLAENLKELFIQNVKITPEAIQALQEIGVPVDELINFVNWEQVQQTGIKGFVEAVTDTYGPSAIKKIKKKFPKISAKDIVTVTNWTNFETEQQFEFLTAVKDAFGAKAAVDAAKAAGVNVVDMVKEGMGSKNEAIRKQAETWHTIMEKELGIKISINVKENEQSSKATSTSIKNTIQTNTKPIITISGANVPGPVNQSIVKAIQDGSKPNITVKSGIVPTTVTDGIRQYIENNTSPKITVGSGEVPDSVNESIQSQVEQTHPTLTAGIKKIESANDDVIKKFKKDMDGKLDINAKVVYTSSGLTEYVTTAYTKFKDNIKEVLAKFGITVPGLAEGGVVNSGQVFVANENGNAEMIGKFGNKAAVANQEQMVEAMARGVEYANAEQNGLLREQNRLLMAILQKEGSVKIGPSAALGRVTRQSIEMYRTAAGV